MEKTVSVDVIIPTFRPDSKLKQLISRLKSQTYKVNKIIIINTDEQCINRKEYERMSDVEIHNILPSEFDHGLTRNYGVTFSSADIVMFMTQDAIPENNELIENIIEPFNDENVYVAYARQIPNKNCGYVEKFIRKFNYPDHDIIKDYDSLEKLGIKAIFCSDVCAAYRRDKHTELGGFISTNFNEDSLFAYKVLEMHKEVYYASKAVVIHSHNYSYIQQFKRNFDIGVSQYEFRDVFSKLKSEDEGVKMVKDATKHLLKNGKWYLIPDLILSSGFKFIGYRMGKKYLSLPKKVVMWCTYNKSSMKNKLM